MENKNIIPGWVWLAAPAAILLTYKLFRNIANSANDVTKSLDNSKKQALLFMDYFGVVVTNLTAFATPVTSETTKNKIALLAMNIDDWEVIQKTFTKLCGGNYTIFNAASTALNSQNYTVFSNYISTALTQKRIFCKEDSYSERNINQYGGSVCANYQKGDFVGRCISEDSEYYYFRYIETGEKCGVNKTNFFLK